VDGSGCAYLAGLTWGGLPVTSGAYDTSYNGGYTDGRRGDAFVTKFDATASSLVYSTYLGGTQTDDALGLALDGSGNALVVGYCNSGFPCTHGTYSGYNDAFVAKLNSSGSALVYSRLFNSWGGMARGVTTDTAGNTYVCGRTGSGLTVTTGAYDETYNEGGYGYDAFVAKVGPNASLDYCTYLGGIAGDEATGVAIDAQGYVYLAGGTYSTNFPTTPGVLGPTFTSSGDAFVTKLHPSAYSGLAYSTYYDPGLGRDDSGRGVCVDGSGNAHVGVYTYAYDPEEGAIGHTIAAELNAGATALIYTAQFGGSGDDMTGWSAILDSEGALYLAGATTSADFSPPMNGYDTTLDGESDGFIVKLGWEQVTSSVVLACPDGGEQWELGQTLGIQWSSSGAGTTVDIELSRNGGGTWEMLFNDTANDGAENWTVSGSVSANCLVRITDSITPALTDVSNAVFAVTPVSGDLDGDQDVDMNDAAIFSGVLLGTDTDPNHMAQADVNHDGNADGLDIQPFLDEIL
jgi:hypothetical protein